MIVLEEHVHRITPLVAQQQYKLNVISWVWINKDITDHDVTDETKKTCTSSKLPMGKSWSKVVEESADYFCSIHVVMKGKLQ